MSTANGALARREGRWRRTLAAFATPSAPSLLFLGFGCGLPFLLVGYTLSIWLREVRLDLGVIGLVSYVSLFYTLKFVWAPLLDRVPAPGFSWLGRRRGWMFLAQLLLALALAGMGSFGPAPALGVFVALMALAALAGATQDTVVDAYRIEIAPLEAQGALAAMYTLGYRLGLIAGGAGTLYLADAVGWRQAYLVTAGLMVMPMVAVLLSREPEATPGACEPVVPLADAFVGPFREFFSRNGVVLALALLGFVGLFKLPDQILGVMAGPFYHDTGYTKSQIATVSKIYGVWIGIAGAMLGGAAVAAFGPRRLLLPAALAVAGSNLLYIVMSLYPGALAAFVLAISGDNFAQGFAGAVLVAFMSGLASHRYTATQYALLSSLANLPGKLLGGLSGYMVDAWSYTGFFLFSTLSIVPTLLLLRWLDRWQSAHGTTAQRMD